MEEMNYFGFENGDEYEIADKKARERIDELSSNLSNNSFGELSGSANIFNTNNLSKETSNGITFTPKYDRNGLLEYINVNGTATEQARYYFENDITFPFDVTLNFNGLQGTDGVYCYGTFGNYFGGKKNVSSETSFGTFFLVVNNGKTVNNQKIYPMICDSKNIVDDYEPYIMSNSQLTNANESLEDYGLVNVFDGQWLQGGYDSSGNFSQMNDRITTSNIQCNGGDTITIKLDKNNYYNVVFFFNDDSLVSYKDLGNYITNATVTVPSNTTKMYYVYGGDTPTPSTAPKLSVYVNNEIDQLKNDLIYEDITVDSMPYTYLQKNSVSIPIKTGYEVISAVIIESNGDYTHFLVSPSKNYISIFNFYNETISMSFKIRVYYKRD